MVSLFLFFILLWGWSVGKSVGSPWTRSVVGSADRGSVFSGYSKNFLNENAFKLIRKTNEDRFRSFDDILHHYQEKEENLHK